MSTTEQLKVSETEIRAMAKRLADLGELRGTSDALARLVLEIKHPGLRAALEDVSMHVACGAPRPSVYFARHPDYFPAGFLDAVRTLEATGDWQRTLGRWANLELDTFYRDHKPHLDHITALVREHPALFHYHDGDNPLERALVLLEAVTRRRDLVTALTPGRNHHP